MATSGSTNYSETEHSLIKDAYINLGAVDPTDSGIEDEQYEYASRTLNRMIKAWQKRGYNLWRTTEGSIALVAGQASYTLTPRPLRVSEARWRNSVGTDLPMVEIAREDYFTYPQKDASGTPTNWYYDPQRDSGTLYVWPVPDTTTARTIYYTYQRAFEDFDNNADNPDVPQEWYDAIVKGLSAELAPGIYPTEPGLTQLHKQLAAEAIESALEFDRETAPVRFMRDDAGY